MNRILKGLKLDNHEFIRTKNILNIFVYVEIIEMWMILRVEHKDS